MSVVDRSPVPLLFEWQAGGKRQRFTRALVGQNALAALSHPTGVRNARLPLSLVSFGTDRELEERMQSRVMAWDQAGRPRTDALRISAYPGAQNVSVRQHSRILEKQWTTLVVSQG